MKFSNSELPDPKQKMKDWVKKGIDKDLITFSDSFGEHMRDDNLKANQIRNIFGEIKKIQLKLTNTFPLTEDSEKDTEFDDHQFITLIPRLAYVAKKAKKDSAEDIKELFTDGLNEIIEEEDHYKKLKYFNNFVDVAESILAYHKYYVGE